MVPSEIEAIKGTNPPKKVPTTGISCDKTPAETPSAIGEGNPINKKARDKTMLANIPSINFATINPPAFETPIVQTWSIEFDKFSGSDSLSFILQPSPSLIK